MTQIVVPAICFLLLTELVGASHQEGYQKAPLLLGLVDHGTLLVHAVIVIALAATLLYPHCLRLVHHVTYTMSRLAPMATVICYLIHECKAGYTMTS
jgi:hypothetical protein